MMKNGNEMTIKLISNKDGNSAAKEIGYTSYSPATYIIKRGKDSIGTVMKGKVKYPGFPKAKLDGWIAFDNDGNRIAESQMLKDLRSILKGEL